MKFLCCVTGPERLGDSFPLIYTADWHYDAVVSVSAPPQLDFKQPAEVVPSGATDPSRREQGLTLADDALIPTRAVPAAAKSQSAQHLPEASAGSAATRTSVPANQVSSPREAPTSSKSSGARQPGSFPYAPLPDDIEADRNRLHPHGSQTPPLPDDSLQSPVGPPAAEGVAFPAASWTQLGWQRWIDEPSKSSWFFLWKAALSPGRSASLFRICESEVPWHCPSHNGRSWQMARKAAWFSQHPCRCHFSYGGASFPANPFPQWLAQLRDEVMAFLPPVENGCPANAANFNLYRDGTDVVGWHADNEALFDAVRTQSTIVSLSLGAERDSRSRQGQGPPVPARRRLRAVTCLSCMAWLKSISSIGFPNTMVRILLTPVSTSHSAG